MEGDGGGLGGEGFCEVFRPAFIIAWKIGMKDVTEKTPIAWNS